jgi:hypothetical protein
VEEDEPRPPAVHRVERKGPALPILRLAHIQAHHAALKFTRSQVSGRISLLVRQPVRYAKVTTFFAVSDRSSERTFSKSARS